MIYRILLLFSLTCCVCAGTFEVKAAQSHYTVEENQDVTLIWTFTTNDGSPLDPRIVCEMFTPNRNSVLLHLYGGVEVPKSQDENFAGRVHWDQDALRDGHIRLHMSSLRMNDSGTYQCEVMTRDESGWDICHLNVTATMDLSGSESESEPERLVSWSWGWTDVFSNMALTSGLVAVVIAFLLNYIRR